MTDHPTNPGTIPQQPPVLQPVTEAKFRAPETWTLSNGTPVYAVHSDDQDVVRIEAVFRAGRRWETRPGVAAAAAKVLREGAGEFDAATIAETAERYGAALKTSAGYDFATLSIHSLNRHLDKLEPITTAIVQDATFPQHEIDTYVRNARQKLRISEEKPDYLADTALRSALFGPAHPTATGSMPTCLRRSTATRSSPTIGRRSHEVA